MGRDQERRLEKSFASKNDLSLFAQAFASQSLAEHEKKLFNIEMGAVLCNNSQSSTCQSTHRQSYSSSRVSSLEAQSSSNSLQVSIGC
jgi:hypothetical protein